jgi:putative flippase GtrA
MPKLMTVRKSRHPAHALPHDIHVRRGAIFGQGFRFTLAGGCVALVYLTSTTLLHDALSLRFQIALAIGFLFSIVLHFSLQRLFVWRSREQFALLMHHQAARYLVLAGIQYGITAACTSQLPSLIGVTVDTVYVSTVLAVTLLNFLVFRGHIFHTRPRDTDIRDNPLADDGSTVKSWLWML